MNPLKYWTPAGVESILHERKNKTYKSSATDETKTCSYTYNELGFRGDSIKKEGFKVMSLGCSNTEGVGVNYTKTWPYEFTSLIPNGVNFNFGTAGCSNDFISRCLLTYYDEIKPDLVLIMYTSPLRREIYTKDGGVKPFVVGAKWGWFEEEDGEKTHEILSELQNDNEDFINWYKNHLLIKYFLESKGCNWLWNGWFDIPKEYKEYNRFDDNYQKFIDFAADGSHPGPNHNKIYADKLHNFITINFPNYINNLPKSKQGLI
jgi:hypothetical protein